MSNAEIQFVWRHTHSENTIEEEHKHDAIEIVYYLRGEGYTSVNGQTYSFKPGTVCYIPHGMIHSEYHRTETEVLFFAFHIDSEIYVELKPGVYVDNQNQLLAIITSIETENNRHEAFYRRMVGALINQLLVLLYRSTSRQVITADELPKTMLEVCRYIRLNSHMDLSGCEIAKQKGYSYDYFRHQFKKYCGIGLKEFIQQERKNVVIDRLLRSKESIFEVARMCNFPDTSTFSRWFKKMTGMSPSAYRKMVKKTDNAIQVTYTKKNDG